MENKASEKRRHISLSFPKNLDDIYVSISSEGARIFKDENMTDELPWGRRNLEIEIPFNVKSLLAKRTILPPIIELGINKKIWPICDMKELRFIFDNRNILMIDQEGLFRETKYKQLCACLAWKNWVLVQYKHCSGEIHAILYWKEK